MTEINRFTLIVAAILAVLVYVASTTLNTESIATTAIPTNNSLSETNNTNLTSTNYCFTIPILPGGIELMKKWNEENIVNNKEHDAVFMTAGITHEQFGFNICHNKTKILQLFVMKPVTQNSHSKY
jgi:hypothetical protein